MLSRVLKYVSCSSSRLFSFLFHLSQPFLTLTTTKNSSQHSQRCSSADNYLPIACLAINSLVLCACQEKNANRHVLCNLVFPQAWQRFQAHTVPFHLLFCLPIIQKSHTLGYQCAIFGITIVPPKIQLKKTWVLLPLAKNKYEF